MPDVTGRPRVLILGGTTEARHLAAALASPTPAAAASPTPAAAASPTPAAAASPTPALGGSSKPGGYDDSTPSSTDRERPSTGLAETTYSVISSLAGRTSRPLEIAGDVRIGGFGGVGGLVDYLTAERIDAVVDATHPFAATMTRHAVEAAAATRTPVLILRRPGWAEVAGDDWWRVRDLTEAAALLPQLGDRVFLTTGRQGIAAFAGVRGAWFLSRSVEEPAPPMPRDLEVVLDRGPFTLGGERQLLRDRKINVLVTKDSGGPAPKLGAARERGIPVIVVDRPPIPEAPTVTTVGEAVEWLEVALPSSR
ncbi:MAG TPA: cobalt-precorrin-6A reductase [Actinoplanes sp.]